ncbi:biopolymer transporter ExbB [Desulfopila inferna]|uniref:biopolymer transporter ExbB n=1 Tax=Desulfopila inferna TaxID=468528 RepID=UPI00196636EB|nr:biopolymer transporter ExbB [Desulfopila inferna]MBM9603296.1 biopolymer transporter ExbB [Desulfopila inferna]
MSKPRYYLLMMFVYLGIVAIVCALLYKPLKGAFMANWGFNLVIFGVLAIGILLNVRRVVTLEPEINWIKIFRTGTSGLSVAESPELLKPLAKHLEGMHRDRFSLSALSLRTVLEGIRGRLDESREISRYIVGLLVFLGLLGTFWGLLGTIGAVSGVIGGFDVGDRDFDLMFKTLKAGLQEPLQGMGTAFSSSLFGLGGSLVLGFLDIQANHAQNRFFNELEEWLSGVTQLVRRTSGTQFEDEQQYPPSEFSHLQFDKLLQEMQRTNSNIEELLQKSPSGSASDSFSEPDKG